MRITKGYLTELFHRMCKMLDIPTSATFDTNTRKYSNDFAKLDHNSIYGGYRIDIIHTGTGESFFDGSGTRYTGREMEAYLRGMESVLRHQENN